MLDDLFEHKLFNKKDNISKVVDKNSKAPLNSFQISFYYHKWIKSINFNENGFSFNNMLKDSEDFSIRISVALNKLVSYVYNNSNKIFKSEGSFHNCLLMDNQDHRKIKLLRIIFYKIYGHQITLSANNKWWQLECNDCRAIVFGVYEEKPNIFYPLFCDWHNLIMSANNMQYKLNLNSMHFDPISLIKGTK